MSEKQSEERGRERRVLIDDLVRACEFISGEIRIRVGGCHFVAAPGENGTKPADILTDVGALVGLLNEVERLQIQCKREPDRAFGPIAEIAEVLAPILEKRTSAVRDPLFNFAVNRGANALQRVVDDYHRCHPTIVPIRTAEIGPYWAGRISAN